MDLRRSARIVGGKKFASTLTSSEHVPDTTAITAGPEAATTPAPQSPPVAPAVSAMSAPPTQTTTGSPAQAMLLVAYQGFDMQQMWFASLEDARRHTVTAWKPNCSEQDLPITDDKKAPFVHYLRNCMLDITDVHGNTNTSNLVQESRFPAHFYEAAAVRVVDAAVTLHLHGKQNRGAEDPTMSRSGRANSARRDMEFRQRVETIGLLFKTEKKIVCDVIKGDRDLEYLCVLAPEVRIKALQKDRHNNGGRPRVPKGAKKRRGVEPEDDEAGSDDEGGEELGAHPQQKTHAVHDFTGQSIPASASVLHNAFPIPTPGSQGSGIGHSGSAATSPGFFSGGSTEVSTPYSMPVWSPQDPIVVSPYNFSAPVPLSPRFCAGRPASSTRHEPQAVYNAPQMAASCMSGPYQQHAMDDQAPFFSQQDNGYINTANTPSNNGVNHPSSLAFDNTQHPSSTQSLEHYNQPPASNSTPGSMQQDTNALMQDPAFLRGYFPQRFYDPSSFSPRPLQQPLALGYGPELPHADTSTPFSGSTVNTQHKPASPFIDPDLLTEKGHGRIGMSPAE